VALIIEGDRRRDVRVVMAVLMQGQLYSRGMFYNSIKSPLDLAFQAFDSLGGERTRALNHSRTDNHIGSSVTPTKQRNPRIIGIACSSFDFGELRRGEQSNHFAANNKLAMLERFVRQFLHVLKLLAYSYLPS